MEGEEKKELVISEALEETFDLPIQTYVERVKQQKGLPADIESLLRAKEYVSSWLIFVRSKQDELYEAREVTEAQYKVSFAENYLEKRKEKNEHTGKPLTGEDCKFAAELLAARIKIDYIKYDSQYRRAKNMGDWLQEHLQDIRQKIAIVRDELDLQRFQQQNNKS